MNCLPSGFQKKQRLTNQVDRPEIGTKASICAYLLSLVYATPGIRTAGQKMKPGIV
jgi:hypothetical protein